MYSLNSFAAGYGCANYGQMAYNACDESAGGGSPGTTTQQPQAQTGLSADWLQNTGAGLGLSIVIALILIVAAVTLFMTTFRKKNSHKY